MEKVFKTYNGGKDGNGTYQNIINHIPKCSRFVEAFAGNCAITRNIARPAVTVINDIDRSVYDKLVQLQEPCLIVENNCYQELIVKYDCMSCDTFFYFDPPYLFSTRKSQQRLYNYEFSDSDHEKFLQLANTVKSNCMISHYPCDLYDNALKGWRTFDFESCTRNGMRTERIYMNYAQPQILQDYRYLGKDFIERQQIKRKTERLLKRLERLPELERTALLSAVIGKYNYASATILNTPQ
jgi:DNA adenine methylase